MPHLMKVTFISLITEMNFSGTKVYTQSPIVFSEHLVISNEAPITNNIEKIDITKRRLIS